MQIGLYKDEKLIENRVYNGLTSDILLHIILDILREYNIERFIYTSGPGSHMATKITYITLKSLEILKDIEFKAISAFDLNENKPIKALGKLYFIKEKENIITKKFSEAIDSIYYMPNSLKNITILDEVEPQYNIDAVLKD